MTEGAVQSSAEIIVELNEKRPMRVLHVDDELDFLKVAKQCLEIEGQFQVDTARSVEEAMEKMKGESYDAVVSDFQMPGKDGLELLKELRQSGNTVPFVIFTGKGREEVAIRALNLGADQYLNKTGNPETVYGELSHAIRQAVEKRESEERLKAIVENTSNVYYSHGPDHVLTYVSPQVREVFGYEPEEVLTNWQNLLTDNPVNLKGIELTQRAIDTGQRQPPYLLELVGRDGRKAWVEVHESPVVRNGKTVAMVGSITDITERRKAEEALRESEEKYKDLFENAMDTILTLDLKGNVTSVNKAILRYGYKKEDVIGKSIRSFIPWNLWRKARDDLSQATKGKPTRNETKIRVPDGKAVVEYRSNPIVKNGKITGVQVILRDIADRKLVEEAHKSEEKFRCLVEETAAPVGICDLRGNFTYVNRALAELLGYSVEEMTGRPFRDFLHPKDRGRIIRVFLGAIVLRREPYSFEFRALHRDGHVLHLMSRPTRFVVNGKTVGFQAIIVDISDLKKAGEELRRFSSAVKTSLDGIVISDMAGRIVEVNDAVLRMFGAADKADLIGKSTFDLIVPEEREKALEGMKKALKEDHVKSQEYVVVTKQGSRLSVELTSTLMKDGEGKPTGFVGIVRDITERKKAEKTNRENQLKFERLFMYNPEPAVYLDSGFRILDINPRFAALFGYSLDEVRGKHINDVAVPEDRLEEARMLDKKAGNGIVYHDTVRKK
ncbi:MAG: PAS domain S-box protein, partial [Candidatus Bathyarchaeia archaeon]